MAIFHQALKVHLSTTVADDTAIMRNAILLKEHSEIALVVQPVDSIK